MKITHNLPQYQKQNLLLAVASTQVAKFFLARNGEILEISSFSIEKEIYTDKEAAVLRSGKGSTTINGAVKENIKQHTTEHFEKKFVQELKQMTAKERVSAISLFIPKQIAGAVVKMMPHDLQNMIKNKITGNFLHDHPFELLRKLQGLSA